MSNSLPINQHYIPKKILKNFASGKKKNQVYMLNKHEGTKIVPLNIQKAACISYFYNYPNDTKSLELDFFNTIDSDTPPIINKIIKDKTLSKLSSDDFYKLTKYVASQICRVPHVESCIDNMSMDFKDAFSDENGNFSILKKELKTTFLDLIKKNTEDYIHVLLKKEMRLFKLNIKNDNEFMIGDNPVVCITEGNEYRIVRIDYHSVIDHDLFMIPISNEYALVFRNYNCRIDILEYLLRLNGYQFCLSDKFVFGRTKEILTTEIKLYHEFSYNYVKAVDPNYLACYNIRKGDPITIANPRLAIEKQLLDEIKEKFKDELATFMKDK